MEGYMRTIDLVNLEERLENNMQENTVRIAKIM